MKKKVIKILIIIFFIALVLFLAFFGYKKYAEYKINKHREEVKEAFYTFSKIKDDTNLYMYVDDEFKSSGKIYKDTNVELENIKEDYYKIKDTAYYVYYKDISKSAEQETYNNSTYLYFDEEITTKNPVDIYQNEKKLVTIEKSIVAQIFMKSEKFYTVSLNNDLYQIDKEQVESVKELEDKQKALSKISILYFDSSKNSEDKIKHLQEKKYTYITESELQEFLNGNIRLPLQTTMIIFKEKTDEFEELIKKYSLTVTYESDLTLKYTNGDAQISSLKDLKRYKITSSTTLSRFKDMLAGKKEVKVTTTQSSSSSSSPGIAVLNYHFFYDDGMNCKESICLHMDKFEEQLKYLKDNGFKTLTMQEFNDWMYGKVELPKKSVLITVDDGAMGTDTILPDLLRKYDAKATLFLISGWWPMSKYTVGNLEIQSHGHDLHHNNFCKNGKCGVKGLLLSKEDIKADLQKSKQTIGGNNIAFCYPFYATNNTLVEAVREEFSLAFVGGNRKATRSSNKYKIPRYIIYNNTSLNSFKNMVN